MEIFGTELEDVSKISVAKNGEMIQKEATHIEDFIGNMSDLYNSL